MSLRSFLTPVAFATLTTLIAQPTMPPVPLGLTMQEVMGDTLLLDFGSMVYDVVIGSDTTFYWKDHRTGKDEHDRLRKVDIDDHSALLGWDENDSTFVSMFIDTHAGTAHVIYINKVRKVGSFHGNVELKR